MNRRWEMVVAAISMVLFFVVCLLLFAVFG